MKPLLWKEMRDLRPWILGAAALALVLTLLCFSHSFERTFQGMYYALMPTLAFGVAIALGAGQMARERSARTMEFLLARPVAPTTIVWAKFLAGTATLAVLVALMTALCYVDPPYHADSGLLALRQASGFQKLAVTLFPRFWCVYSFALLVSVLVDRMVKAAAAAVGACILTFAGMVGLYADLVPFNDVEPWLSVYNTPQLMLRMWVDPYLVGLTGLVLSAAALLIALGAALLFLRRPNRILGNRTLVAGAALFVCLVILSAKIDPNRLPVLRPAGSLELLMDSEHDLASMQASGNRVAVAASDSLAFLDFSDPVKPRKVVEAPMPLWETTSLTFDGDVAYLVGTKKAVPKDEIQIAIARLSGDAVRFAEPLPLGTAEAVDFARDVAVNGHFLYAHVIRQRHCRVEVYDLGTHRQVGSAEVDTVRPDPPGTPEREIHKGFMRMVLHGRYLYVTSPSALTTIDVGDPQRPLVTSRIAAHQTIPLFYGFWRNLATDGRWLLESDFLIGAATCVYDLTDPAHPAPRTRATAYGEMIGTTGRFFQSWQHGVLEFRAGPSGLNGSRYLTDGREPTPDRVAATQGRVYILKHVDERRFLSVFRVR